MHKRFHAIFLLTLLAGFSFAQNQGTPRAVFGKTTHTFGSVKQGEVLIHKFAIKNDGTAPLILDRVELNAPGWSAGFKPVIEPGSEGAVAFEFDTFYAKGDVAVEATLLSNDPAQPSVRFNLYVSIEQVIDIQPLPEAFISTYADEKGERTLRIVNLEDKPIEITKLETKGSHFKAELKKVEPGKVYELIVTLPAGTTPGRYQELVLLHTNHPSLKRIPVGVNLFVRKDLYANPEAVDFTGIKLSALKAKPYLIDHLYEMIMLKKRHGDFEIKSIQTDVPFLKITQSPASGRSPAFKLDIGVEKEKLVAGEMSGTIQIFTDDKNFPKVQIPVKASVE